MLGEIEDVADVTTFNGEIKYWIRSLCYGKHDEVSNRTGRVEDHNNSGGGGMVLECGGRSGKKASKEWR